MQTASLSPTKAPVCNPELSTPDKFDPARIRNTGRLLEFFALVGRLAHNQKGYCWARNRYLAQRLGASEDSIGRWIKRLEALGALSVEQVEGIERRLRPLLSLSSLRALLLRGARVVRSVSRSLLRRVSPNEVIGQGDDNKPPGRPPDRPPGNVVVPPAPTSPDPGILAQKRSPSRPSADEVAAAEAAVRAYAQRHAVRSMGALLTAAIKGKWTPPAPVRDHPSDRIDRPVRVVTAPEGWSLSRNRSAAGVETTGAPRPMSQGGPSALLHGGQKAPTDAQEPQRAVPGLAPVSTSSSALSPALAAILGRCEARRGGQA